MHANPQPHSATRSVADVPLLLPIRLPRQMPTSCSPGSWVWTCAWVSRRTTMHSRHATACSLRKGLGRLSAQKAPGWIVAAACGCSRTAALPPVSASSGPPLQATLNCGPTPVRPATRPPTEEFQMLKLAWCVAAAAGDGGPSWVTARPVSM